MTITTMSELHLQCEVFLMQWKLLQLVIFPFFKEKSFRYEAITCVNAFVLGTFLVDYERVLLT